MCSKCELQDAPHYTNYEESVIDRAEQRIMKLQDRIDKWQEKEYSKILEPLQYSDNPKAKPLFERICKYLDELTDEIDTLNRLINDNDFEQIELTLYGV